jgi:hypothetical protein
MTCSSSGGLNSRYGILALLNDADKNLSNPIFAFAIGAERTKHPTTAHVGHHAKTPEWRTTVRRANLLRINLLPMIHGWSGWWWLRGLLYTPLWASVPLAFDTTRMTYVALS